jgi:MFS family permease
MTLLAGIIVDRFNRKQLMMLGDTVAALSTFAMLLLYLTNSLQIWHLYLVSAINGGFSEIQQLAYSASITQIVPPQHYTRATSMGSMIHYGASIFAPALAGSLYPLIGLLGTLLFDLGTFGVAIATLLLQSIPQPTHQPSTEKIWQQLTFGFRYILTTSSLTALLMINTLFWFAHDLGGALYTPMISPGVVEIAKS